MKMKKGLLMVVLLLALSSVMAAMSYSSAKVTSAMTGTVKSTDASLLALNKGTHKATTIENGILKIDFNKGDGTNSFGLQPDSEYVWNDLFSYTNNSENTVDVRINTVNDLHSGVKLEMSLDKANWVEVKPGFALGHLKMKSGEKDNVSVRVVVEKGASLGDFSPNFTINGVAEFTPPGRGK